MTPSLEPGLREEPGGVIGPYTLRQIIGEGGFGTVWLAEQSEPLTRRVALKVLKPGMDSREILARFEQERQVLALMEHPSIARVYDAGLTRAGRPYFAMELVKGEPITEYCDKHRFTVERRLELFGAVCDAVQHAHMKGVLHRDLKPSNILVCAPDGASARRPGTRAPAPQVKVIDFGLAKAMSGQLTDMTVFTEYGRLMGTPDYMSPEQAEMSATEVDTRSDIYSLGVVLYELLTGALPVDPKELRSGGYESILRTIREQDPPRPALRISSLEGDTSQRIAAARGVGRVELLSSLRGEVEWIPLKAMRKDRAERYRSAAELSDDIANHLAHRPLLAGPESTAYVVRKFVRRNRGAVTAGALLLAALVLGLAGTIWQARAATRERDLARTAEEAAEKAREEEALQRQAAEVARREAEAQRDKAELVAGFMGETLEGAVASIALGRDVTMLREMMDAAADRILDGELDYAPEAELQLRTAIGNTYTELAALDAAEEMLAPALALAHSLHTGDHEAVADTLRARSALHFRRGELAEAERLQRNELEMVRRLEPGDHPRVVSALGSLGSMLVERGDLAVAEDLSREALEMARRLDPGDHEDVAEALQRLAGLLWRKGEVPEASRLLRESVDMRRRLHPEGHPALATSLRNLGVLFGLLGDLDGSEVLIRQSLELTRRLYEDDHDELAAGLQALGGLMNARGNLEGAEPLLRESLAMTRRLTAENNPKLVGELSLLASVLQARGSVDEAEELLREAVELARKTSEDRPRLANAVNDLGMLVQGRGDLEQAELLFREALGLRESLFPGGHPDVARSRQNVAGILTQRGEVEEAERLYREALATFRSTLGDDSFYTGNAHSALGSLLLGLGRFAEAEREFLEMERIYASAQDTPPGLHAIWLEGIARFYDAWDRAEPDRGHDDQAAEWRARPETPR
jgi:serine/threonine protein kinase/Tfp pilus assembly protein PilF